MLTHAASCYKMPQLATTGYNLLHHATTCHKMPPYATRCYNMILPATTCHKMLHHATTCYQLPAPLRSAPTYHVKTSAIFVCSVFEGATFVLQQLTKQFFKSCRPITVITCFSHACLHSPHYMSPPPHTHTHARAHAHAHAHAHTHTAADAINLLSKCCISV